MDTVIRKHKIHKEDTQMAEENQEPWKLYDPEQVRCVVESVEDPETKAILYSISRWSTAKL